MEASLPENLGMQTYPLPQGADMVQEGTDVLETSIVPLRDDPTPSHLDLGDQ